MERIKISKNGQWQLVKSLNRNLYAPPEEHNVDPAREQQEAMSRAKGLNTNYVKNMNNHAGVEEPHVLVHRGIHSYKESESQEENKMKITPSHVETSSHSVHTLDPDYAHGYTTAYSEDGYTELPGTGRVFSFWVPKSKINTVGEYDEFKHDPSGVPYPDNYFISIQPGKYTRATPEEVYSKQ
jgi:hypothetical protein